MSEYRLVAGDSEQEVRTRNLGPALVPWTDGIRGEKIESDLLTVKEGFRLPDVFFDHWADALGRTVVSYVVESEDSYSDMGWALYDAPENGRKMASIELREPLTLFTALEDRVQSSAAAHVTKLDTYGLFRPRGAHEGEPELEGDGTATLLCEHFERGADTIAFDYALRFVGQGWLRFYHPTWVEWLSVGDAKLPSNDREERCRIEIAREGRKQFVKGPSGKWDLLGDVFRETWQAQSTESDVTVDEGNLGGPGETVTLTASDLPRRERAAPLVLNVRDFGAKGDGQSLDTGAIETAIGACNRSGGCFLRFPAGVSTSPRRSISRAT